MAIASLRITTVSRPRSATMAPDFAGNLRDEGLSHPERSAWRLLPAPIQVTDDGGPFRLFELESCIIQYPELKLVRICNKTLSRKGSRERSFGTFKYER